MKAELPRSPGRFILLLQSVAYLIAGLVLVTVVFFFAYAVIWFGYNYGISAILEILFSKKLHLSHSLIVIISGVFVALLFAEQALVKRNPTALGSAQPVRLRGIWLAGLIGSCCALLANARASSAVITDILLLGPRLIFRSFSILGCAVLGSSARSTNPTIH